MPAQPILGGGPLFGQASFTSRKCYVPVVEDENQECVAALFCVERDPAACHRSLLAERLKEDLGAQIDVAHFMPNP